ncbi:hypothetical protein ABZZ36_37260 [Actinacidiphila glaucinigra]|uniref:hypothetical protein n=1 Tax=Actinacidiphila glaucinigra TaxID=235986 RepID=UPI0033AE6183
MRVDIGVRCGGTVGHVLEHRPGEFLSGQSADLGEGEGGHGDGDLSMGPVVQDRVCGEPLWRALRGPLRQELRRGRVTPISARFTGELTEVQRQAPGPRSGGVSYMLNVQRAVLGVDAVQDPPRAAV